jgi:putative hydrolase of HD superfamily
MEESINNLIDFYKKAEKLKTTTRHSWLSNPTRQESAAEHSWMLCLLAMVASDQIETKVDLLKVMKMVTIHDLAEAVTGDIPSHEISERNLKENKYKAEETALQSLVNELPKKQAEEMINLWREMEENKTAEAQLSHSLDKIEAIMQHNIADISTWDQGDFDIQPYYKDDYFNFDTFIRAFKNIVDNQTIQKIISAKSESRIDVKHLEKYKLSNKL